MSGASASLRTGDLARRTGVSPRSLRYYEQQELLRSGRTAGGQRVYGEDAVDRVELIQLLFRAGVPSSAVVELLPCITSGTTTPAMVTRLVAERERIRAEHDRLGSTLERLDRIVLEARRRVAEAA